MSENPAYPLSQADYRRWLRVYFEHADEKPTMFGMRVYNDGHHVRRILTTDRNVAEKNIRKSAEAMLEILPNLPELVAKAAVQEEGAGA